MTSTQEESDSTNENSDEIKRTPKKRRKQAPILSDSEENNAECSSPQKVPISAKERNDNDFEIKEFISQDDLQKSLTACSHHSQVCLFFNYIFQLLNVYRMSTRPYVSLTLNKADTSHD